MLRHYFRARDDLLASIVSEAQIDDVVARTKKAGARLHVVYREADYAASTLARVQGSLTQIDHSPNRFRIVRSQWH